MTQTLCDRRIYHHVFCSQLFGFLPLGLCRRQPRNRRIHRQVCWKRHRISGDVGKEQNNGFVGFLGNAEPKWCRKYRKWLCCEISQLNPDLRRVWPFGGIFGLTFFREGRSPASPLDEPPLVVVHFFAQRKVCFFVSAKFFCWTCNCCKHLKKCKW